MYTEAFKAQMVRRMIGPPGVSATFLAKESGVSQSQLCRWSAKARTLAGMPAKDKVSPPGAEKRTVAEKLRVLVAAQELEGEALGALLRREGLHEEQLRAWRDAAGEALSSEISTGTKADARREAAEFKKRAKLLERELRRKEKALAEAAAMLLIEKKLQALGWGGEGGGTGERNDE